MGWKRRVGDRGNEENGMEERTSPEKREREREINFWEGNFLPSKTKVWAILAIQG